jgi:hypothetical protein
MQLTQRQYKQLQQIQQQKEKLEIFSDLQHILTDSVIADVVWCVCVCVCVAFLKWWLCPPAPALTPETLFLCFYYSFLLEAE